MANSQRGINRVKVMRMVLILVGLLLIYYVERNSHRSSTALMAASCPSCSCDCVLKPTISLPLEVINSSLADCGKDDPEANNEMKKDIVALYTEEINLHENVTSESLQRTKALILGAKRTSSHYQKEAEKCNAGMETCEEARERAEVTLIEERKLTAIWMSRAREYGWKDDMSDYR